MGYLEKLSLSVFIFQQEPVTIFGVFTITLESFFGFIYIGAARHYAPMAIVNKVISLEGRYAL
jgi:hypothetical protein